METRTLDPLLQDALTEVLNLGIGRAASSLNELVQREVLLSVPEARLLPSSQLSRFLSEEVGEGALTSVRMEISGQLEGSAFLLFPDVNSLQLVRSFVGDYTPLDVLQDLEREALLEVGNLVLNACVGTVGDTLGASISTGLPAYHRGPLRGGVLENEENRSESGVFVKVRFEIHDLEIVGVIALLMGVYSVDVLTEALKTFVAGVSS